MRVDGGLIGNGIVRDPGHHPGSRIWMLRIAI